MILTTSSGRLRAWRHMGAGLVLLAITLATPIGPAHSADKAAPKAPPKTAPKAAPNSCVDCHSDPRLLVQNKKLHDYFEGWKLSIHAVQDVTCADCHGGDPRATNKATAHGTGGLGSAARGSPTNYRNIPDTCARCHKDITAHYKESLHFEHLAASKDAEQGPNCVTCHGSVNTSVLTVNTVRKTCEQCHNRRTDNSPEIPEEAEVVLNNFLSISRFYRAIALRSTPEQAKAFFQIVDPMVKRLNVEWHSFDLPRISEQTHNLVEFLKVRRSDLKKKPSSRRSSP